MLIDNLLITSWIVFHWLVLVPMFVFLCFVVVIWTQLNVYLQPMDRVEYVFRQKNYLKVMVFDGSKVSTKLLYSPVLGYVVGMFCFRYLVRWDDGSFSYVYVNELNKIRESNSTVFDELTDKEEENDPS